MDGQRLAIGKDLGGDKEFGCRAGQASACVSFANSSGRRYTSDLNLDGAVQADVAESSRPELSRSPRDDLYKTVSGWVG